MAGLRDNTYTQESIIDKAKHIRQEAIRHKCVADDHCQSQTTVDRRTTFSHSMPRRQCSVSERKLVLHFDLRNTVIVADSVTEIGVEQALNSFLTSVTWGQIVDGAWSWCANEPSLTAPRPGVETYYKSLEKQLVKTPRDRGYLRKATGDFTQEAIGEKFLPYFETHLKMLEWNSDEPSCNGLTMRGYNDKRYHYILPSFIKLLYQLHNAQRDFAIVIRTYGLDCANVLSCIQHIVNGLHPQFRQPIDTTVNRVPGRISRKQNGDIVVEIPSDSSCGSNRRLTEERDIYRYLSECRGICGFVDDFKYWQDNSYSHFAGKPLWIDPSVTHTHHIFFDDNIRVTDMDSIVDVRMFCSDDENAGRSLQLDEISTFEDMCLVQADLLQSIQNTNYFIEKVDECESNYTDFLKEFH